MAKTGHPNINLRYDAPWRGITKTWSVQFNYSGILLSAPQQLAFAQAVHNDVISTFFSQHAAAQFLSGWSSYDGTNSAEVQGEDYGDAAESSAAGWNGAGDYGTSYDGADDLAVSGLESCAVLLAPLGLNSKGKPYFMRKFIHGCPGNATGTDQLPLGTMAAANAAKLGDGSLPGTRVLCTDKGGQGTWNPQAFIGNHQLFRKYVSPATRLRNDFLRATSLADRQAIADGLAGG